MCTRPKARTSTSCENALWSASSTKSLESRERDFELVWLQEEDSCCNECLYVKYNTLPPAQLFNYQVINLVHKTLFTPYFLPLIFQQYFSLNQKIQFSQHQSHLGYRTVKFKGSQLWNRLPHYLVEITSPASFRKSLKHYLTYNPM